MYFNGFIGYVFEKYVKNSVRENKSHLMDVEIRKK